MDKPKEPQPAQEWLSPRFIADTMGVHNDTVLSMVRRGELEGVRFGGQVRISRSSFERYLQTHRIEPGKGASHE
jgi:excisionase family DNA binding protein